MSADLRLWGVRFRPPPAGLDAAQVMAAFPQAPGLYVHIPFCSRICPFCPYNKVLFAPRAASGYLSMLRRELDGYLAVAEAPFTSLYVGGGTPTLGLGSLGFLAGVAVAGERAMEILPSHMTPRTAGRLRELGFDSVSIGVQSFHERVLQHLQRPTDAATNRRAVACAREHFGCVDVDLIFDVAYDGPETLLEDLDEAFGFGVDQVSTYPLMRFGYTPFGKAAHERRAEHEVLRRAMGAGAATFAGSLFSVNHFGLAQYWRAVASGRLPIALQAHLPRPAAVAYRAFWQGYTGSFPVDAGAALGAGWLRAGLRAARAAGLVQQADGRYRMTVRGYDAYHDAERMVTYRLIEPLWAHLMAEHDAA